MRKYLLLVLMSIPFISSCISDDCTDCADMTYDMRLELKVNKTDINNNTKATSPDELKIHDLTIIVLNGDGSINATRREVFTNPETATHVYSNINISVTASAQYIYAIANCSDDLFNSIRSQIVSHSSPTYTFPDNTLSINYADKLENDQYLLFAGYAPITHSTDDPPHYSAEVTIKPIVSKFIVNVSTVNTTYPSLTAPLDYGKCIKSVSTFILNSRENVKLFNGNTANSDVNYLNGAYENYWNGTDFSCFANNTNTSFLDSVHNSSTNIGEFVSGSNPSFYVPENDISTSNTYNTLVVLKVVYEMRSIDNTLESFVRYFTVKLNPDATYGTNLSVARGVCYTINFNLSGKYWGALSPLSSMMAPYSPLPTKGNKDLIYVPQEKYSTVKVSNWN